MFDSVDPEFRPGGKAWLDGLPEPDWFDHPVYSELMSDAERVTELLKLAPAARPVAELASIDAEALGPAQQIDLIVLLQEQQNCLEAPLATALAAIDKADSSPMKLAGEAVALALKVPLGTARHKIQTARTLVDDLPATLRLLARGEITGRHAETISKQAWPLDPELLTEFENRVLKKAGDQSVGQLRAVVRRTGLALDPATAEQRHQRARADRKVGFIAADDGMALLPVLLPASDGQAIFTRLTAAATLLPAEDQRSMDQKRADLLVDAVLSGIPHDALPELTGRKPSIQVVVSADTLLELDDEPAHLNGYGPITAETARRLAADESGTWRRLLTDPDTGALLDISEKHYKPSQRLRDYVAARDGVCCFPACNQPGYRCEYEHIVPYLAGGRTCRCNAALACRRHNRCKIATSWSYEINDDGSFTWTTDTGHAYRSYPPQRWSVPRSPVADPEPDSQPRPEPPAAGALDAWWAAEDAAYQRLRNRQLAELARAQDCRDTRRIARARKAIEAAEQQQERELAHRAAHPGEPPF